MIKKYLLISLAIILTIIVVIIIRMDISINSYDLMLAGENENFQIKVDSSGKEFFYMWDGTLRDVQIGSTIIEIYYIGKDELTEEDKVEYSYAFEGFGGSGERYTTAEEDGRILKSKSNDFITKLSKDYVFDIGLNDELESIKLIRMK